MASLIQIKHGLQTLNDHSRKELATLQRQVEHLGRSLPSTSSHSPSINQAPSSHTATTDRISHSHPDSRPDYTGTESSGDTAFESNQRNTANIDPSHTTNRNVQKDIKDDIAIYDPDISHDLPNSQTQIDEHEQNMHSNPITELMDENLTSNREENVLDERLLDAVQSEQHEVESDKNTLNDTILPTQNEQIESNASENEIFVENAPQDDRNQIQYNEELEYVNETIVPENDEQKQQYDNQQYSEEGYQNYEQHYEQPQYTEQYENYEQYPQQQYADPSAEYQAQYENYPLDENYTEQTYDNVQYNQEYTETQQYSENEAELPVGSNNQVEAHQESQEIQKDSPIDKVARQS